MRINESHIKNGLYLLVIAVLWLPIVQTKFKLFSFEPLSGEQQEIEDAYISKQAWLSGEYQEKQEQYVKNTFGGREPLVRLYNQWHYSFYNTTSARGVVIGRDGYLYEENYIKAHLGLDFIGEDSIHRQVSKLRLIADSLKAQNIDLVVLLAPGKGSFYPDYFPQQYDAVKKGKTNYETYKNYLKQEQIHVLDFSAWFQEMKPTVHQKHKLFSKTGIHWSKYGEYLVADSLLGYLQAITKEPFPDMKLTKIDISDMLRDTDNDIWKGMNLMTTCPDFKMTYPITERVNKDKNQTKVLTIADSYYWGLMKNAFSRDYFNNGEFWYYFKESYTYSATNHIPTTLSEKEILPKIKQNRVVVMICTDANLYKFGFGFIDQVYNLYK